MTGTSLSTTVAYRAGRSYGVHFRSALWAAAARRRTTLRTTTAASAEEREYMGPSLAVTGIFPRFRDRKSTRLNSSHSQISYAVFCLKKKKKSEIVMTINENRTNVTSHNIIIDVSHVLKPVNHRDLVVEALLMI